MQTKYKSRMKHAVHSQISQTSGFWLKSNAVLTYANYGTNAFPKILTSPTIDNYF